MTFTGTKNETKKTLPRPPRYVEQEGSKFDKRMESSGMSGRSASAATGMKLGKKSAKDTRRKEESRRRKENEGEERNWSGDAAAINATTVAAIVYKLL